MTDLYNEYRPTSFDEVLGQKPVIDSLKAAFSTNRTPHTYLLSGMKGIGKTTIARLIAQELNCLPANIIEHNAAQHRGVEETQTLVEGINNVGMSTNPVRVYILDEVHTFSNTAWKVLLKPLEETPDHIYFVLCTTEPEKVPDTIQSRACCYTLAPVAAEEIAIMLEIIALEKGLPVANFPEGLQHIANNAWGSVRSAISDLAKCGHCITQEDLNTLIYLGGAEKVAKLVDYVANTMEINWADACAIVAKLPRQPPENTRLDMIREITRVLRRTHAKGLSDQAIRLNRLLNELLAYDQWPLQTGEAPIYATIWNLITGDLK